jgi:protein tyrosine/serine phosphatase
MSKKFIVSFASFLVGILGFTFSVSAQASPDKKSVYPNVKISNFGQLDDRFFRGARPSEKDMIALKSIGINTIIDLTDNSPEERSMAEAAGLKYVNVAIPDKSYPTQAMVDEFLKVANDPATGKFYVHCAGGRHRTGDMGAVYRFANYGWDYAKVMQEMENFDFYTSNGHGKQKDFVVDYAQKYELARAATATTTTVAGSKL